MQPRSLFAIIICLLILATAIPGAALADDFKYMSPDDVKQMIDAKEPMHLVDIQVEDEFATHHIAGATATYAYPVKSDADKAKVDAVIDELKADDAPIVIICPRGKGGAERTYTHLKENNVDEARLYILEKGQAGWPYPEYIESE